MKNSKRFGTEELARIEAAKMLEAREKSANLEYEIFMRIRGGSENTIFNG